MNLRKKRKKRTRMRGTSSGWGARKKHRGKGSHGGKGMAGTGKKAGQKKTWILKYQPDYFGRRGFVRHAVVKKLKEINLDNINLQLEKFIKQGIAKKTAEGTELNLEGYKVLGKGKPPAKLIIKASSFSKSAKEKLTVTQGRAIEEK